MIQYNSIREIVEAAEKAGLKISELCLKDQAQQLGITEEGCIGRWRRTLM